MKKLVVSAIALVITTVLLFIVVGEVIAVTVPPYSDALGDDNYTEKITGLHLVKSSAARPDNVIIYGSSELRTLNISTHPANFFADKRTGFQVNLVGRGSCQSIIHALNIASTGTALTGKKVVLITSPQSYVEEGIAPDLFAANFSELQYTEMMLDPTIPEEIKEYISGRVSELLDKYAAISGNSLYKNTAADLLSGPANSGILNYTLKPFFLFTNRLQHLKDLVASKKLIESVEAEPVKPTGNETIDWEAELDKAILDAEAMTTNNSYGMLNDYYTTYVGRKHDQQKGMESTLSYTESKEYGDLEVLLEICKLKGIEPLFVHVPLHGSWSDHTGFSEENRAAYYSNVREIVGRYENVQMLDLTSSEYDEYYLCDVMHLGWKGWLEVDKAIDRYYHQN